jgi:polar amino acid transport system substrate-binding protein
MRRGVLHRGTVVAWIMLSLFASAAPLGGAAPLEQVQRNGALRLCANPAALPYSNRSAQNGLPGFQVELATAVSREMGLGLTVAWVQGLSAARKAECDASMDARAVAAHYDREGQTGPLMSVVLPLRYSKPYAGSGIFLVVPSGSPAQRFEDLNEQKVGVIVDSVANQWLARKGVKVSSFAFQDDIVGAVQTREIGAGAVTAPIVGWYRHEHPDASVTIPEGYEPEPALRWNVAIGLWGADDALLEAVNAAIDRVVEQRIPHHIYAKYGVAYHPPFPASGEAGH